MTVSADTIELLFWVFATAYMFYVILYLFAVMVGRRW